MSTRAQNTAVTVASVIAVVLLAACIFIVITQTGR